MIFGEHKEDLKTQAKVRNVSEALIKKCEENKLLSDLQNALWQAMNTFDDVNDKLSYWMTLLPLPQCC